MKKKQKKKNSNLPFLFPVICALVVLVGGLLLIPKDEPQNTQTPQSTETGAKAPDFTYCVSPIQELSGKTFGIYGFGTIGQKVAVAAKAFGMDVKVCTRTEYPGKDVQYVTKEELFSSCDVISLHCPLTNETKELINRETLSLMKKNAILINTGRGGLIDEEALAEALNEGRIAGAGLDVLKKEPPLPDNPLVKAKNTVITPHVAWASKEARERLIAISVDNVRSFLEGKVVNKVN